MDAARGDRELAVLMGVSHVCQGARLLVSLKPLPSASPFYTMPSQRPSPPLDYNALSPSSRPIMLESRRQFRAAQMRRKGVPFSGPYYWVPTGAGAWRLLEFADRFYGAQADHTAVWPEVVSILAMIWNASESELLARLESLPYGVPRGRVTRMGARWGLFHGDGCPPGATLDAVKAAFHLDDDVTDVFFDEHEQMLQEDVTALMQALSAR